MDHRERILNRILKKNFLGAVTMSKKILPSKISLFDASADVSMESIDSNKDRLTLDYGDKFYTFDIVYTLRKTRLGETQYVISSID